MLAFYNQSVELEFLRSYGDAVESLKRAIRAAEKANTNHRVRTETDKDLIDPDFIDMMKRNAIGLAEKRDQVEGLLST